MKFICLFFLTLLIYSPFWVKVYLIKQNTNQGNTDPKINQNIVVSLKFLMNPFKKMCFWRHHLKITFLLKNEFEKLCGYKASWVARVQEKFSSPFFLACPFFLLLFLIDLWWQHSKQHISTFKEKESPECDRKGVSVWINLIISLKC